MRLGNPLPTSLPQECSKAARIFRTFVNPSIGIDTLIPNHVLRSAQGFVIFTVIKAGFLMSVRAGTGIVIGKLPNGDWSAPSAIGTGGIGIGTQAGGEITEFVVVLNSKSALRQFMSTGSISLGGNLSIALGPLGRNAEGSTALNSKGKLATMYSYSRTKGAFAGLSLEGSMILERQDCNAKCYGSHVTATKLLSGQIDPPDFAMELIESVRLSTKNQTEYVDESPNQFSRHLDDQGLSGRVTNPELSDPFLSDIDRQPFDRLGHSTDPYDAQRVPTTGGKVTPTYGFGSQSAWSSGMSSPGESTKRPKPKKTFSLNSWRKSSSQSRILDDPESYSTVDSNRQKSNCSPRHWIDSMKTEPKSTWLDPQSPFHTHEFFGSHPSKPDLGKGLQPIGLRHDSMEDQMSPIKSVEEHLKMRDEERDLPNQKFDSLSLSSIESEEPHDSEVLNDWEFNEDNEVLRKENGMETARMRTKSSASNRSNSSSLNLWDLRRKKTGTKKTKHMKNQASSSSIGFVNEPEDLMWFDHHKEQNEYEADRDLSADFKRTRSLSEVEKELAQEEARKKILEESDDFLVGTVMPSVMRTKTELIGFKGKAIGLYDFEGNEKGDLSFKKGDVINLIERTDDQWWLGSIGLRKGIFPVNRVQMQI